MNRVDEHEDENQNRSDMNASRQEDHSAIPTDATGPESERVPMTSSTVIAALDQVEDLIREARIIPLSSSVMVNRAEALDLIDQVRQSLPEDLVAADALVADANAVLDRADSAAEVAVSEANVQAHSLVEQAEDKARHLVEHAQENIERELARAHEEADRLRAQARSDAEMTIADSHAEAQRIVDGDRITRMAKEQGNRLVGEAHERAEQLTRGADEYVASCLGELGKLLSDLQGRTNAGRRTVADRSGRGHTDIPLDND